jgi:hypothetical protein
MMDINKLNKTKLMSKLKNRNSLRNNKVMISKMNHL